MTRALQRHQTGTARVIPIILRPVDWEKAPFSELKALPTDGKPITGRGWHNTDEAFTDVARGIREAVETKLTEAKKPFPYIFVQVNSILITQRITQK